MHTLLLTLKADYSDEFDCQEYLIVEDERSAETLKAEFDELAKSRPDAEFYFGTNEALRGDQMNRIQVIELDTIDAQTLESVLGKNFGTGSLYGMYDVACGGEGEDW